MTNDPVIRQIRSELSGRIWPIATVLGQDIGEVAEQRITDRAGSIAALLRDPDDRLAAQTTVDLLNALFDSGDPPPAWWRSPLGQVCAASLGTADAESVTRSVAAAMLGVHPGTVAQLVHRGTLDRHPDGGILRASVLQRIAQRGRA